MIEVALSLLILSLWAYSCVRSGRMWIQTRDARSLRNLLLNVVIVSVAVVYVLGAYAISVDRSLVDAARFLAWVIRGELLIVGVLAVLSWHPWRS